MVKLTRQAARAAVWALLSLFVVWGAAHAAVPQQINYQGYLTNAASQPVTATLTMVFRLYTAPTGGTALYAETQSVAVANGIYNVAIGSVTPLNVPFDVPYFLGVSVGTDAEMTPRQAMLSSPYALHAGTVDPTSSTLTGNFFRQGGNAFGAAAVLGTTDNQPLDLRVNGQRVARFEPNTVSPNVVQGNPANFVAAGVRGATIAGGGVSAANPEPNLGNGPNVIHANYGTVGGGFANQAGDPAGTVLSAPFNTVGGGRGNIARGDSDTVGGGEFNTASSIWSTVGGGGNNTASGFSGTVGGGDFNIAGGAASTVPGGRFNAAVGHYSFAAGYRAKAVANGSFVWADSTEVDFPKILNPNFFAVRATGGVGFTVKVFADGQSEQFCNYLANTSGWDCTSDRNTKENFVPVDGSEVLHRLAAMPLFYWNFKGADPAVRNLGPTAQDFYGAFGLGRGDKTIATGNLDGVALAAIQGLNAKLDAQAAELASLRERLVQAESVRGELAALRQALADLRETRSSLAVAGAPPAENGPALHPH